MDNIEAITIPKVNGMEIGTLCWICDAIIPLNHPNERVPNICPECKERLKKILYPKETI